MRFLQSLLVTLMSRRGTRCTLSILVEPTHGRHELAMVEDGRCGHWAFHTFSPREYSRIDELLREGIPVRPGTVFERCCRAMALAGCVEIAA